MQNFSKGIDTMTRYYRLFLLSEFFIPFENAIKSTGIAFVYKYAILISQKTAVLGHKYP